MLTRVIGARLTLILVGCVIAVSITLALLINAIT
jgi:hypothetical protein